MVDSLYLDTARIGQISPSALRACNAVGVIADQDPKKIFEEASRATESQSSIIPCWRGLAGFEKSMLECFKAGNENRFFLANHSTALVKATAQAICLSSQSVFCTDLIWPRHRSIFSRHAKKWLKQMNVMPIRRLLKHASSSEIAEKVAEEFLATESDALFLTAVSSDGFRLPIQQIVHRIRQVRELRFVAVDGAQEFAQCDCSESWKVADIYLFSSHKWLGGYHPLTLGLYGKRRSREFLETTISRMVRGDLIEDPLLRFQDSLRPGDRNSIAQNETVNVLPVLAASGALNDLQARLHNRTNSAGLDFNRKAIADIVSKTDWNFVNDVSELFLQTRIVTLKHKNGGSWTSRQASNRFSARGIVCSSYDGGTVRLSLPEGRFNSSELDRVSDSLSE